MENYFDAIEIFNESFTIQQLKKTLQDPSENFFLHLIKFYCWGHQGTKDHWAGEIARSYTKVQKMKKDNKLPSANFIESTIWDGINNDLDHLIDKLNKETKYKSYERIKPNYDLTLFCKRYVSWLANELSQTGTVNTHEARDILYSLLTIHEAENML